jgi:transposase InsO family protein
MDWEHTGYLARISFLIRDRDGKYPALIDEILAGAGITTVSAGVRTPRMNSIIERWVKTLRAELLDRMAGVACGYWAAPTDPAPPGFARAGLAEARARGSLLGAGRRGPSELGGMGGAAAAR